MLVPTDKQLQARLARLAPSATPFEGVVYRSSSPAYATETDLLTGEGSRRFGGRWNPPGIALVYASLTPETAMAETLAHYRYFGIPIEEAMPRTFIAIEVKVQCILDLRDGKVRQRLQLSEERIVTSDWRADVNEGREPISQRLGRAAHVATLEGLIVPSAADRKGHNLLIFPDRLRPGSTVRVVNPDKLANA